MGTVGSVSDSRVRGLGFNTRPGHILESFFLPLIQEGSCQLLGKVMQEVLVTCLGGQNLPMKSVARLTDPGFAQTLKSP